MTKTPICLQDLRRRIYIKAKEQPSWRFWGLYGHVCKMETLREGYRLIRKNRGAPGIDGETFAEIETLGVETVLAQLREELVSRTYRPRGARRVAIPKANGGGQRVLSIPTIRDRVVQGALKLILEPIFEAKFQPGSYGYRPKKSAHDAVRAVGDAIVQGKTRVIDLDLRSYFDSVRHDLVLREVAACVNDDNVMWLLRLILKASGKRGLPQGGPLSPVLSNLHLNEVDKMLERAKRRTRHGTTWTAIEYARFADDLVVLVDGHSRRRRLFEQVLERLREEFEKLDVSISEEKSRVIDLTTGDSFSFLGFDFRRVRAQSGKWAALRLPRVVKRTALVRSLKEIFRRTRSQSMRTVIDQINPVLRGWVNYFRIGNSSRCFGFIRNWVEKKIRRHLMRARQRKGFGWKRWSNQFLYERLGLFSDYQVRMGLVKVAPVR